MSDDEAQPTMTNAEAPSWWADSEEPPWWGDNGLTATGIHHYERLARRYRLTLTELFVMARADVLVAIDPEPGGGDRFVFERPNVVGLDYLERAIVPAPDANVDIVDAMSWASRDSDIGDYLLDTYPGRPTGMSVYKNSIAWFRFWAIRDPRPDRRAWFKSVLDASEAKLAAWEALDEAKRAKAVALNCEDVEVSLGQSRRAEPWQ